MHVQEAPSADRSRIVDVICRTVTFDGDLPFEMERPETIVIRPMSFRRWTQAISHVANLSRYFPNSVTDFQDANEIQLAKWITTLLGNCSSDLFGILELATDKSPAYFDLLDFDDALKIIIAVIEVNKDYYVTKLLPLIPGHAPATWSHSKQAPDSQIL